MDATLDLKTNPNLLVAKKSTKEKLKEAYAKYARKEFKPK